MNVITKAVLAELKSFAYYNPDTGVFTATRQRRANSPKVGAIIGTVNNRGYLLLQVNGSTYGLHVLAWLLMTGDFPKHEVDHINGNKQDNRWSNLRDIPHHINTRNRPMQSNNTSGYTGVTWDSVRAMWRAQVCCFGKGINISSHFSIEEAVVARDAWIAAHPEFGFSLEHGQ
jgi:hypothetical protein